MDIQLAKKEFMKYVQNFDTTSFNIKRKIDHSIRTMQISTKIAKSLDLEKEYIDLATLIGLLHDIGRFEQVAKYNSFNDSQSIDHGEFGVEILMKHNYIRKFIKEDTYDQTIKTAIRNHNKFKIEEGLTEEQLLFTNIIRDADKLDILYQAVYVVWKNKNFENGKINKEAIKPFIEKRPIDRQKDFIHMGEIKNLLTRLAFVYDMNFEITFKILKETDYINKFIDRFDFKDAETKLTIEEIRTIVNTYIENKQKG